MDRLAAPWTGGVSGCLQKRHRATLYQTGKTQRRRQLISERDHQGETQACGQFSKGRKVRAWHITSGTGLTVVRPIRDRELLRWYGTKQGVLAAMSPWCHTPKHNAAGPSLYRDANLH
jgi:hypothetical protein